MVRCHCWVPLDRVPVQGAIAGTHFDRLDVAECHCKVPLLWEDAIAGCWVPFDSQVPLLGAIAGGGDCTRWRIGRAT